MIDPKKCSPFGQKSLGLPKHLAGKALHQHGVFQFLRSKMIERSLCGHYVGKIKQSCLKSSAQK